MYSLYILLKIVRFGILGESDNAVFLLMITSAIRTLVFSAILAICLICSETYAADKIHVAFLAHDSLTSTGRTLHGARKTIRREHPEAIFHTFIIGTNTDQNLVIVDSISIINPRLILTVGSAATSFAQDNFSDIPIVFSAVKYPVLSGFINSMSQPERNTTGASLNIPVDVQFRYFKEIIPDLKKIGVLYTSNTESLIPQARIVAESAGLSLVALQINNFKEIPNALDSLSKSIDGMWAVADPNLFDPRSTKFILLNIIRKSMPLMGFSRHIVESGALFALDFDYKAIGFQAGGIANKIIAGKEAGSIPVTMADVIWFHYNAKTAEHIRVTIPEELVAVAKEVYR